MVRSILLVLGMALVVVAAGCWGKGSAKAGPKGAAVNAPGAIDFEELWPKDEVAKLSPEQRARLLELALAGLKGPNWQHARDVLIALGRDSIEPLIGMVGSDEPSASARTTLPNTPVRTVGELAHDTLLLIMVNCSNFKGRLPLRDAEAWKAWWAANNNATLVIGGVQTEKVPPPR